MAVKTVKACIQRLEDAGFVDVEYLPQEYDIAWTSEAWIIHRDATTTSSSVSDRGYCYRQRYRL